MKISAIVLTYNSDLFLERCLNSLKKFDELIAVDAGSTDNTLTILKKHNVRILTRPQITPKNGFGDERNWAMLQADNDFVFFLDSDEEVNPNIYDELQKLDDNTWLCWIPRITLITEQTYAAQFTKEGHLKDPQARFMKIGYAQWRGYLHELPEIPMIKGTPFTTNDNIKMHTKYHIRQLGYLVNNEANIKKIVEKQQRFAEFHNRENNTIFGLARNAHTDVIEYIKNMQQLPSGDVE